MTTILSKKNSLNLEDIKRILRNALLLFTPVILTFLDQIQAGTFDYKILYAMALGIILDAGRRYIRELTT